MALVAFWEGGVVATREKRETNGTEKVKNHRFDRKKTTCASTW